MFPTCLFKTNLGNTRDWSGEGFADVASEAFVRERLSSESSPISYQQPVACGADHAKAIARTKVLREHPPAPAHLWYSASHLAERANIVFEGYVPSTKLCALDDLRLADPVHAEVAKILAGGIPGHEIPK